MVGVYDCICLIIGVSWLLILLAGCFRCLVGLFWLFSGCLALLGVLIARFLTCVFIVLLVGMLFVLLFCVWCFFRVLNVCLFMCIVAWLLCVCLFVFVFWFWCGGFVLFLFVVCVLFVWL